MNSFITCSFIKQTNYVIYLIYRTACHSSLYVVARLLSALRIGIPFLMNARAHRHVRAVVRAPALSNSLIRIEEDHVLCVNWLFCTNLLNVKLTWQQHSPVSSAARRRPKHPPTFFRVPFCQPYDRMSDWKRTDIPGGGIHKRSPSHSHD